MLLSCDAPPPITRSGGGTNIPVFRNISQARILIFIIVSIPNFGLQEARPWAIEGITMLDAAMIERGLEKTGKSKGGLAAAMGVRPGAVSEILGGERLGNHSDHGIS
jgi:hypothetical protein